MYRVALFIDGGYINKVLRHEFSSARIDYVALSREAARRIRPEADILRSYYYNCLPYQSSPPTEDEKARFAKMQRFLGVVDRFPRFVVRKGRLARRGPDRGGQYRFEQKMIDVYLSIDLVQMSLKRQINHAVIMAGDSDYVPAIEVARNEGVVVWLFHGERIHSDLYSVADERVKFTQDFIDTVLRSDD